jgi:hypothetical protein
MTIGKYANGQSQKPVKHNQPSGKQHAVSVGTNSPIGNFSTTHELRVASNYSWSNHRFGRMDVKPVKPFGFIANAGYAYYFGKSVTVSGNPYDYPGYHFLNIYGGVIYNPWRKANINLTIGPAMGIYNGNTRFNFGGELTGSYYFKKIITVSPGIIAISPGIIFMKEPGAVPLWAKSLKVTMAF